MDCLAQTFRSGSSQTSSIGYNSADCSPLPIHKLKNVLFFFAFNAPLVEFISIFWVNIFHENKSLTQKPLSRWDHVMLQYAMIAGLIQFAIHLVKFSDFGIGNSPALHNRASCIHYG